jgi:hypothetical protein
MVKRAKSDFTETKRVPFATGINASFCNSNFSEKEADKKLVSDGSLFPKQYKTVPLSFLLAEIGDGSI